MKNILLILTAILLVSVVACTKARQKVFHHKSWENIQGTWDMKQCLIDDIDSTSKIKNALCYFKFNIKYQTKSGWAGGPDYDDRLHLFHIEDGRDFGYIALEYNKYKKIFIQNGNLNLDVGGLCLCTTSLCNQKITWDILNLTKSELIIETVVNKKKYHVEYEKN